MDAFFADYVERLQTLSNAFVATFADLPAEALDWVPGEDMNSFTVLVVHTTGSARYWIGDVALGEPSNRDRAAEFTASGLGHEALKARFDGLLSYAQTSLRQLNVADLGNEAQVTNRTMDRQQATVGWALLHALEHTALHVGHAQITRQLWQQRG